MDIKRYLQSNECITTVTLLIFMLCGAWARITGLSEWYWSPDDAIHLAVATGKTPIQVIQNLIIDDTHPPLYYFFLHYMQIISKNDMFLRASSLVPGLLLIPLAYLLGRLAIGRAAGFFIAFIVAFGYGTVVISEVIRQYTLFLCMISGALCCMFAYNQKPKQRYLVGYGILMFLGLFTHYTSVIVITGTGIVWFFKLASDKKYKEGMNWVAIHLMLALTFGAIYYFFIVPQWIESPYHEAALSFWLMDYFPGTNVLSYVGLLVNFIAYISFMDQPALFVIFLFLNLIGIQQLIANKQFMILALSALLVAINIVLAMLVLYPFIPGHQCLYLLPFLILIPAFAFQKGVENFNNSIKTKLAQRPLHALYGVLTILSVIGIMQHIADNNFYRTDNLELPVKKTHFNAAMDALAKNVGENDLIITEKGTAYYFFSETFFNNMEKVTSNVMRINYAGKQFYYANMAAFELRSLGMLQQLLVNVDSKHPLEKFSNIWFVSTGWCRSSVITKLAVPEFIPSPPKPIKANLTENYKAFLREERNDQRKVNDLGWQLISEQHMDSKIVNGCPLLRGGVAMFSMKPSIVKKHFITETQSTYAR